jgi:transcriptional antiterminator NusG
MSESDAFPDDATTAEQGGGEVASDEGLAETEHDEVLQSEEIETESAETESAETESVDDGEGEGPDEESAVAAPLGDKQWYVLKVQSNREKSIRSSLLRRIKRDGLEDYFGDVIIPTEKVAEKTKGGKKRVVERKLYPGYIMIQMVLNDETWYLVRDTGGVGDFTGSAGKPSPMHEDEIKRMLGLEETKEAEPAKIKIDLTHGETVKIKEGSFESFEGVIESVDEEHGKITVLVEIFGRSVPTELEYWQVEKID